VARCLSYAEAVLEATSQEMERDDGVIVLGLGVDDVLGTYGTTKGLAARFGAQRVFGTPLSEDAMTGVAIGAAQAGLRPIHVHARMDFLLLAMNQLVNIAAKSRYMFGGAVRTPLVIRAIVGRGWGQGGQHSQALHSFMMHVPGIKVCAPSTPHAAKGCLISAIRDDNPVVFMEHRMLYPSQGNVPDDPYEVALGAAHILARGTDVTLVGISHAAQECLRARSLLAAAGIDAEVIDPVSLSPLDTRTVCESAERTGALLVVDVGWTVCGAGSEIALSVVEQLGTGAVPRIGRMGLQPTTCPTSRPLQELFYPTPESIAASAYRLATGEAPAPDFTAETSPELAEFKGPF
jgi:acetoin:2,6-dichlorophenolindophenol oxidoreductase subunit beta